MHADPSLSRVGGEIPQLLTKLQRLIVCLTSYSQANARKLAKSFGKKAEV